MRQRTKIYLFLAKCLNDICHEVKCMHLIFKVELRVLSSHVASAEATRMGF